MLSRSLIGRAAAAARRLGRPFLLLWGAETVNGMGSAWMQFALGVWVYRKTLSTETYAWTLLCGTLPGLATIPVAGAIADKLDRRWVIATADALGAVLTIAMALIVAHDLLTIPVLCALTATGAVLGSLKGPSYQAAVGALLPEAEMSRASALMNLSGGAIAMIAPITGGLLMSRVGLPGVVAIQIAFAAVGTLGVLGAISSRPLRAADGSPSGMSFRALTAGLGPALGVFRRDRLLAHLFLYGLVHDGLVVLVSSLIAPLILSTDSSTTLGLVGTFGAAGGLAASLVLAIMNPRRALTTKVLVFNLGLSACVVLAGLQRQAIGWCACAFVALFASTAADTCAASLWLRRTPSEQRGAVFATINLSHLVVSTTVMIVGGALVEHVFTPALASGGSLEPLVLWFLGPAAGRAVRFLFVVSGVGCALVSLAVLLGSQMRRLEDATNAQGVPTPIAIEP